MQRVEAGGHRLVYALESAGVAGVVAALAGSGALRDVSIVEPDIEDVVARLYRRDAPGCPITSTAKVPGARAR